MMSVQCKVCGLRYRSQYEMTSHMDWHFGLNERERLREKHTASQDWYQTRDEWDNKRDMTAEVGPGGQLSGADAAADGAEVVAITADKVPVPSDDNGETTCDLCNEMFEQDYDDEEETWIFREAVMAGDSIRHIDCHNLNLPASHQHQKVVTAPASKGEFDVFDDDDDDGDDDDGDGVPKKEPADGPPPLEKVEPSS